MATAPPTGASNTELVSFVFECLNRHDVAPLREVWAQDGVERFPDETCHGFDAIKRYLDRGFAGLPDFHMEVRGLVADGDDVFVRWHLTGTHSGAFNGLDPTGRSIDVDGMDHFELRGGRIVSNFVVFD